MEVRAYGFKDIPIITLKKAIRSAASYQKLVALAIKHIPVPEADRWLIDIKDFVAPDIPIESFIELHPLENEEFREDRLIDHLTLNFKELGISDVEIIICPAVRVYVAGKRLG